VPAKRENPAARYMDILGTNPVGKKEVLVRGQVSRAEKKPVRAN
jgi:hypothetical protein